MATAEIKPGTAKPDAPPKKKHPGGRPPLAQALEAKASRSNAFFDAVSRVPQEDWGTRVILWLYRLEPYTDRRKSGDYIYLMQYLQPVDENRVMMDFGSGRYRLMLTNRKPGADRGDELDKYEFEIINQTHPPKIPPGEWIDDPRNIKWAWARPAAVPVPGQAQPQTQGSQVLETLQVMSEVQRAADERADRRAAAPASDPIDSAVRIIQLTKGGGETVLMEMFGRQLERAQDRADKLEAELRTQRNPAPTVPTDPFAQLTQMADGVKKLKDLGLFGGNGEKSESAIAAAVRSRMGPWMEFFQPVLPEVAGIVKAFAQPLAHVMAQKMMQPKAQQPGQPAPPPSVTQPPPAIPPPTNGTAPQPQAQPAPQHTPEEQGLLEFINAITPRMLNHLHQGIDGGAFAAWVADGYSLDRVQQMQLAPPSAIVDFYKQTPYWQQLADREASFIKFLEEFNTWKPEEDDETPSDGEDDEKQEIG